MAFISGIYMTATKAAPMELRPHAELEEDLGLVGDRYWSKQGVWTGVRPDVARDLTLITAQGILRANGSLGIPFTEAETRRNITISDMSPEELNEIADGKLRFLLGDAILVGVERADPCELPSERSGKPGFAKAFMGLAGIRARVVQSGRIVLFDELIVTRLLAA